jgi:hypothetical protein
VVLEGRLPDLPVLEGGALHSLLCSNTHLLQCRALSRSRSLSCYPLSQYSGMSVGSQRWEYIRISDTPQRSPNSDNRLLLKMAAGHSTLVVLGDDMNPCPSSQNMSL